MTPGGSLRRSCGHLRGHRVGHGDGVAGGLARDVQQHRVFAVGGHRGVDGHGRLLDRGHVGHAHGSAGGRGLHHQLAQFVGVVHLRAHQAQDQLVIGLVEAGRVHNVRGLNAHSPGPEW